WLTVLMLLLARAAGAQSVPQDFARGIEIRTEGTATIFRVGLPRDVYATVTRADLADLRVFNAAGVPVPMTLRRADLPPPTSAESVKVPLFPMDTAGAETNT